MAKSFDLLQNESGDMLIQNGDFVIGESDQQHCNDLIYSNIGWWKEYPAIGVNIMSFLSGSDVNQNLNQKIRQQLTADGYTVNALNVSVTNEELTLDLDATRN